jgi:hypothetical protein
LRATVTGDSVQAHNLEDACERATTTFESRENLFRRSGDFAFEAQRGQILERHPAEYDATHNECAVGTRVRVTGYRLLSQCDAKVLSVQNVYFGQGRGEGKPTANR